MGKMGDSQIMFDTDWGLGVKTLNSVISPFHSHSNGEDAVFHKPCPPTTTIHRKSSFNRQWPGYISDVPLT